MGCIGCTVSVSNGDIKGCNSNGACQSGSCNRLNTFDWLARYEIDEPEGFNIVEVNFKNGARKGFYINGQHTRAITGDDVVVETANGYDIGKISLSGDLVRLQMKKKSVTEDSVIHNILRKANQRDMEKLQEAREMEGPTMVKARVIARTLGLDMKIGDVEYQGDKRKATFYYTADGRVDFRELIRHFAKDFKVKIEMRQIGARQESARIGGLGSCGRELCCSTWLSDFKSVSTAAARYQNLAINQAKLSGQCGRLKCCLNYELDTYMEAIEAFPDHAEKLDTEKGRVVLVKTDIFKGLMYYAYEAEGGRGKFYPLPLDRVRMMAEMNKNGQKPVDLESLEITSEAVEEKMDYEDVTGVIDLPDDKVRRNKKRRKGKQQKGRRPGDNSGNTSNNNDNTNNTSNSNNNQNRNKNRPPQGRRDKKGPGNNNSPDKNK